MANEEVLGPRKTMFVIVIVVGCFAVLWPRILSPLVLGSSRERLASNQLDRDAGCCEVLFEKEIAILELLNEICGPAVHVDGKLSPYAAAECRKTVNETCGLDIADFLKRSDNVGKTSKMLVETMKNSNSSCLKEHFGVPIWSLGPHLAQNAWTQQDTLKQERSPIRGAGPHPAMRERGRAIPAGTPPPASAHVTMPPHVRVRSSPLSVYFELDIKPPPIPGMRPPLGSPGGPVTAPKSSMGFVMPIYTICIILFFVYTLCKILFKRTGPSTYEAVTPDPQFRRRVFRDDSRTTPDKLGPKERDTIVTAISGLVAEVQQQMEADYAQNQQRQDAQDNTNSRPYTNGTILHNSGPVHIVASEYREPSTDKSVERQKEKEPSPVPEESEAAENGVSPIEVDEIADLIMETVEPLKDSEEKVSETIESVLKTEETKPESKPEPESAETIKVETELEAAANEEEIKESTEEPKQPSTDSEDPVQESQEPVVEKEQSLESKDVEEDLEIVKEPTPELKESSEAPKESTPAEEVEAMDDIKDNVDEELIQFESSADEKEPSPEPEIVEANHKEELFKLTDDIKLAKNEDLSKLTEEFLKEEKSSEENKQEKQSTPELLEEAIKDEDKDDDVVEQENASVKVVGMEMTAHTADGGAWRPAGAAEPRVTPLPPPPLAVHRVHEAEEVKSIFLETEIPQQSRVLVADFAEDRTDRPAPTKHSPMVVSGKMTLSLIQDAPRETPEREPESTVDEFTTASAVTENAAEKDDEASDEEIEEEIEIEEIEEEVEEEEEEEEEVEPKTADKDRVANTQ